MPVMDVLPFLKSNGRVAKEHRFQTRHMLLDSVELSCRSNTSIQQAITEAISVAKALQAPVKFEHNDIVLTVFEHSDPEAAWLLWCEAMGINPRNPLSR